MADDADTSDYAVAHIQSSEDAEPAEETLVCLPARRSLGSPSELVECRRSRMAAYKYPREVVIVDTIPKTATGKILRRSLRQK